MSEMDLSLLTNLNTIRVKRRKGRGNYATRLPGKKGKGLWMKDAFDLVVAKPNCQYAIKVKVDNDAKIEGSSEERKRSICNGCLWLEWSGGHGYYCTNS